MHNYLALTLLVTVPAFGQMGRGNAGSRFSGLHNHWAIPIDGGKVWAWDMNNPASTDCRTAGTPFPNNATFTGSTVVRGDCTGSPAPTLSSLGLLSAQGGRVDMDATVDLSSGFTLVATFNPTTTTGFQMCGIFNENGNTFPQQYAQFTGFHSAADFGFYYQLAGGTLHQFETGASTITAATWNTTAMRYTSASGSSAQMWLNNKTIAASWVVGNGNTALPAVQPNEHINLDGGFTCVGTIGYEVVFDHAINYSAEGFIYYALYRAMQFRGVSLP